MKVSLTEALKSKQVIKSTAIWCSPLTLTPPTVTIQIMMITSPKCSKISRQWKEVKMLLTPAPDMVLMGLSTQVASVCGGRGLHALFYCHRKPSAGLADAPYQSHEQHSLNHLRCTCVHRIKVQIAGSQMAAIESKGEQPHSGLRPPPPRIDDANCSRLLSQAYLTCCTRMRTAFSERSS